MAQVEVARGSQRLSGFDVETMFITLCVLFGMFLRFLVRKALCMQFGTLTWTLSVFSFISAWHFNMAAASHCSCFSQCVGCGQGSAAGAAEDHMMCMLDASKCMGLLTCCAIVGIFGVCLSVRTVVCM